MNYIPKTLAEIEALISNEVEESMYLEYKSAESLQNNEIRKREIGKDISSMANAAGGVIIYGLSESRIPDKTHLPEKLSPIDRNTITKEWLEQVILSNISPIIKDIKIHVVTLHNFNEVAYVIEIPQSQTVHQCVKDHKYYRRRNFIAEPMPDYEIREALNRTQYPTIEIQADIRWQIIQKPNDHSFIPRNPINTPVLTLNIMPTNMGTIFAKYVSYYVYISAKYLHKHELEGKKIQPDGCIQFYGDNTFRDVIDFRRNEMGILTPQFGPSLYHPILPGMRGVGLELRLEDNFNPSGKDFGWEIYADNAPSKNGRTDLSEIIIQRH